MTDSAGQNIVLFDWDGTLVDTLPLLKRAHNLVRKHFGYPLWDDETARQNIRLPSSELFPALYADQANQAKDMFYDYVREYHVNHLRPQEGAEDMLGTLTDAGTTLGVASNKAEHLLRREIQALGWDSFFQAITGMKGTRTGKPTPDLIDISIQDIITNNDTGSKHAIYYIGDTAEDMLAAERAGVFPVFVEHGFGHREKIKKIRAVKICRTLIDLDEYLQTILKILK